MWLSGVSSDLATSSPVVPDSGPNAGGMLVYLLDPDGNRVELIQE